MAKWIWICLLFSLPSHAGLRTQGQIKATLKEGTFTAVINDGYHLNEKAPNSANVDGNLVKPTSILAREIKFNGLGDFKFGMASIYICDDAVTFCETALIDMKTGVETVPAAVPLEKIARRKKKTVREIESKGRLNKHGFIEEDYGLALAQAKQANKLVLVDFSARWCPGCVRLETEIFPTSEFAKLTQDFVKLKIDLDRFENLVLSEKFVVKAIPTLLVLTAEQEEVNRIADYQSLERLGQFFESIKADPVSLRELSEKARTKDPAVQLRFGKRLLAAGRAGEALEVLKQLKPAPPEYLEAKVLSYPKDIKVLRQAIAAEPSSARSLSWRTSLASQLERYDERLKVRNEGIALADDLLGNEEKLKASTKDELLGEFTGFERFLIATSRAELVEASGASAGEADAAWKKAAQIAGENKVSPRQVGVLMRQLIVLTKAKEYQAADRLARRLLRADPKNPELQRRRLRLLYELKDFEGAVALGKKVIQNSYGRNEFWAAEMTAKAYAQTGRKREARDFIDNYIKRNEMSWPNMKESRKNLEELRAKLAGE